VPLLFLIVCRDVELFATNMGRNALSVKISDKSQQRYAFLRYNNDYII